MQNDVLIVAASEAWLASCTRYFEERDFIPVGCTTFEKAGLLVETHCFSIAIIDFFIGEENGGQLCDRIESGFGDETGLIIVSERQTPEIERAIRRHSPLYYFIKPCSLDNIYAVARKTCAWRNKNELQKQRAILDMLHDKSAGRNKNATCGVMEIP